MNWVEVIKRCANPFFAIGFVVAFPVSSVLSGIQAAVEVVQELLS